MASAGSSALEKRRIKGHRALYRAPSYQSQLELNDIPEFANEPGPGHYFGPGSIGYNSVGKQQLSKANSAPSISIPRTGWGSWEGIVVSKGHQGTGMGKETTKIRDGYQLPEGLSSKTTTIGTSLRPDVSSMMGADPKGSPGPNINLREVPGASPGEPGKTKQSKTFGLADRFSNAKTGAIGPGEYPRKDTAIKMGGGKSIGVGRSSYDKVITPGWEEYGKCRANNVGPNNALWQDIEKDGSHSYTIGRGPRFASLGKKAQAPGPGQYDRNERSVTRSKQVVSDTTTPGQVHFGYPPKKPRYRLIHAATIDGAKHGAWGYH